MTDVRIPPLQKMCKNVVFKNLKVLEKVGDAEHFSKQFIEECLQGANLEQLRKAEKILKLVKRKDVKNEAAWKELCSKKYSIKNKENFPELSWRQIFEITEKDFEKRLELSRKSLKNQKDKELKQKESKGTVMMEPILSFSSSSSKRRSSSSRSYVSSKPSTSIFKNSTKSLFPRRN